ncbi:MAG: DHH family phosphoesterase [Clostridia bacterium]|nr:DHH family phosphoesterase [Clostridia bacterium]
MKKKNLNAHGVPTDKTEQDLRHEELLREFHASESPGKRLTTAVCILVGFFVIAALILYAVLFSSHSANGGWILPQEFPVVAISFAAVYALLCTLILIISGRTEFSHFRKQHEGTRTAASVIRLFKEEIDLPYVVTSDDGKIIVANRAFEDAVAGKHSAVGEDIREICSKALDRIIRTTAADHDIDQKIGEIHAAAVRAYPTALRTLTTTDACLSILREIDALTHLPGSSESPDPDSPLHRMHEIASDAFREAENRSELWHLCLGTLEGILNTRAKSGDEREKFAYVHDIARKAYHRAIDRESELLHRNAVREFTSSMREIIAIAENDITMSQIESAAKLRLGMFENKQTLQHTRTVLLNIRRKLTDTLPDPTLVTEDKETITLQALLRITDESLSAVHDKLEARKNEIQKIPDGDRDFCIGVFSSILRITDAVGPDPVNHAFTTVRTIADAVLCAFAPDRIEEYVALVARELLTATEEKHETSPSEDEIRTIAQQLLLSVQNGARIDEERFIAAFRDALRRISEESRFGADRSVPESERIRTIIEKTVSGTLSFLEIRTTAASALSKLVKYGEETLTFRDLEKGDRKLVSLAITQIEALRKELLSMTSVSPTSTAAFTHKIVKELSDLLSKFDEKGDYALQGSSSEDERSAPARMKVFYAKIEQTASLTFAVTAQDLTATFFDRASLNLMGYRLYPELLLRSEELIPASVAPEASADASELLPEASQKVYADSTWHNAALRLLLHIGTLHVYAAQPTFGSLSETEHTATAVFEKLLVRRILAEALVFTPVNAVRMSAEEGASDEELYKIAVASFRSAPTHDKRVLHATLRALTAQLLSLLDKIALTLTPTEEERDAFVLLRTEIAHARALLMSHSTSARSEDSVTLCADLLKSAADALAPFDKKDCISGALRASLLYLAGLMNDINSHLLRREFYRTYRDTASEIVSRLYRAEYARSAIEQIREISESVLTSESDRTITFAGLSIEDCCSADLRTIAGLAGHDHIAELSEFADHYAKEALTAKAIWELRKDTLSRISARLDEAEHCSEFHDKVLIPERARIARLRKVADAPAEKKKQADGESPADVSAPLVQREIRTVLGELRSALQKNTDESIAELRARFDRAIQRVEEAETNEAFFVAFTQFYHLLNAIGADTLSFRKNKSRIRTLRRALASEAETSFVPETNVPISHVIVHESFSEYLNATVRLVRPAHENDPPMDDIYRILMSVNARIEDDDTSGYFRLYAISALSEVVRNAEKLLASEQYEKIRIPLLRFFSHCTENMERPEDAPTRDSVLRICNAAFREVNALYRLGEIANESLRILTRFSDESAPGNSECNRIYNTLVELSHKVETNLQSVPRAGNSYDVWKRLAQFGKEIRTAFPHLEKDHSSGAPYAAMLTYFRNLSDLTSPYLCLIENKDAQTFRTDTARTRRDVREMSESTALTGSRAVATSALASIGKYAAAFEYGSQTAQAVQSVIEQIAEIEDGLDAPERIYTAATEAIADMIAHTGHDTLREYAKKALIDLTERCILYRYLVTAPIEKLSQRFPDPTDKKVYESASALYSRIAQLSTRYHIELTMTLLRNSLRSVHALSDPGAFSRIRGICTVLERSVTEFEAELRALPLGIGESFVPPTVRAKQQQLRAWLVRLFEFAKRANAESAEDREKARIAERVALVVYDRIATFDAVAASKEDGAMNRLPALCREIVAETLSALRPIERADSYLSEIRRRTDALLSLLTLPSALDDSISEEDYVSAFESQMRRVRKELNEIAQSAAAFREEIEETSEHHAVGSRAIREAYTVVQDLLTTLHVQSTAAPHESASLCSTIAALLSIRTAQYQSSEKGAVIAVYDKNGKPVGQNNAEAAARKKRDAFIPVKQNVESTYAEHGLSIAKARLTAGESVTLGERRYIARSYPHRSGGRDYYLVTFTEVEETLSLKQSCEDENTVVALITLDNLEELAQYVRIDYREAEKEVERVLREWAGRIHGIFHEYERDKYILFFSQKELPGLVNSKFSDLLGALETIKLGDSSVSVTISMGLSALGNTLTIKEQNANQALDMALKRGGAQIVIYRDAESQEDRYEFFTGNSKKGLQKENRVGARVVAGYLCDLIRRSGDVLVMGHSFPDFDSIGSCVGIAALARYFKKDVHIVVNRNAQNFIDCTPDLLRLPEYRNIFIDGPTGMEMKGTDTLLILCDVSNTNIMEYVDIARTSFNTVIIDHHFKTTDSDDLKTMITYIDPSASSASELVAEILEESLPKDALRKEEANVLLSGIMVDTKNFTRSVGARTFAAALYLRQMGANAEISGTYFYEQPGDYKAEVLFRKNLGFHEKHPEVAITYCLPEDIIGDPEVARADLRVAASKAADKLLTVRGIRASFALYPYSGGGRSGVAISGRSDGSINVQQILEAFHGGGHYDSAGANLPNKTVDEVREALSRVIRDYFAESDTTGEDDAS